MFYRIFISAPITAEFSCTWQIQILLLRTWINTKIPSWMTLTVALPIILSLIRAYMDPATFLPHATQFSISSEHVSLINHNAHIPELRNFMSLNISVSVTGLLSIPTTTNLTFSTVTYMALHLDTAINLLTCQCKPSSNSAINELQHLHIPFVSIFYHLLTILVCSSKKP